MRASPRSILLLFFLAACGGNVVVDGAVTTGGAGGTGGVTGVGAGTGQGGTASVCLASGPATFPQADKVCFTTGDCTQQDIPTCCTTYVVGVASAQLGNWQAYEAACVVPQGCGCIAPPVAEDGKMGNIQVHCQSGLCMTYVP